MPHALVFEKDVAVPVGDGNVLRANVFRPDRDGRFPVVMAQGIYGKDVHFEDAFKPQWQKLLKLYPGLCQDGSTGRYLRWETVDPERWVPDGYVVVQVDARGSGKSPGYLDPYSPREIQDYYDAIQWAGAQAWSNGKVGLIGVSYYSITQWLVAALQPPHLKAIVPWEGACDHYRDWSRHGGVLSGFAAAWWPRQVLVNQHGSGASPYRDRDTGERTTGDPLSDALLAGNRSDYPNDLLAHALDDAWHRQRTPDLSRVEVPVLSAGNWGGPGIHLRGNIEGFMRCASKDKWLSMHTGTHYESFYLPQYVAMQKRFFDRYLKDEDNGWDEEPRVQLSIRVPINAVSAPTGTDYSVASASGLSHNKVPSPSGGGLGWGWFSGTENRRAEKEFPLARTVYTRLYLDAHDTSLGPDNAEVQSTLTCEALSDGVSFTTAPFEHDTEITGFVSLRLWVASSTADMDIFATLRAFDPQGTEVIFDGAHEPTPVTRGWLRASHRDLDAGLSTPERPYHSHRQSQKLSPGLMYRVDVELWPTSMVYPKGYRLALNVQGRDFQFEGIPGRIVHDDPTDRDPAEFGGTHTIATGGPRESYLVLPVIPAPPLPPPGT
jgi:predicted acyl esterase